MHVLRASHCPRCASPLPYLRSVSAQCLLTVAAVGLRRAGYWSTRHSSAFDSLSVAASVRLLALQKRTLKFVRLTLTAVCRYCVKKASRLLSEIVPLLCFPVRCGT